MKIDQWITREWSKSMSYMDRRRSLLPPAGTYAKKAKRRIRKQRKPSESYLQGLGVEDAQVI